MPEPVQLAAGMVSLSPVELVITTWLAGQLFGVAVTSFRVIVMLSKQV